MAFRHGDHGTLTRAGVVWRCPTCNTEVTTPLEQGCPQCKAGADAKAAAQARQSGPKILDPFMAWRDRVQPHLAQLTLEEALRRAWEAGVDWANGKPTETSAAPVPHIINGGRWALVLVNPEVGTEDHDLDPRTLATLLAALAFYRDNTLQYGAVPGQLSAAEVGELIEKLQPEEVGE